MGDDALAPLKKHCINFGDMTAHLMIKHLLNKTTIKMMTSHKYDYKTKGYCKAWDPTTSITAYFTGLNRFQVSPNDRGIMTSIMEKTMVAGACMWESEMFTKDQWWHGRISPLPTKRGKTSTPTLRRNGSRGTSIWQATAKQLHFKEVALVAQEQASAEEEGETQAMTFALLQDQHKSQLEAMVVENKVAMDAMMECMNAILGGDGCRTSERNKETPPPATSANRGGNKEAKKVKFRKKLCPHCNMFVFHKPDRCYVLEGNKDNQWVGWKLSKEAFT